MAVQNFIKMEYDELGDCQIWPKKCMYHYQRVLNPSVFDVKINNLKFAKFFSSNLSSSSRFSDTALSKRRSKTLDGEVNIVPNQIIATYYGKILLKAIFSVQNRVVRAKL